jgi:hypothetical protein
MSRKSVTIFTEIDLLERSYHNALEALKIAEAETERCKVVVSEAKHNLDEANKIKRMRNGVKLQRGLDKLHMKIKEEHEARLERIRIQDAAEEAAEKAKKVIERKQREIDAQLELGNLGPIKLTPPRGGRRTRKLRE